MSEVASDIVSLWVHVPIACFRRPYARDYMESFPIAPPSTVYGMLLSLVGEENRLQHQSARLVVGAVGTPGTGRVLRTMYRWKDKNIAAANNRIPNWQELLTNVWIAVWLADGESEPCARQGHTLRERVQSALQAPESVERFGGLCLGESTHLVNGIWPMDSPPSDKPEGSTRVMAPEPSGSYSLPIWPDHVGSKGTRWGRYEWQVVDASWSPESEYWTQILPL